MGVYKYIDIGIITNTYIFIKAMYKLNDYI